MRLKKTVPSSLDRAERIGIGLLIVFLAAVGLAWVLYSLAGPQLIESIYNGNSLPFLNRFIQYQDTKPLDHYLDLGNRLASRLLIVCLLGGIGGWGLCEVLYRLIFSPKLPPVLGVIALCMFLLAFVYYLNPSYRIISNHGFLRASIVYQILNGHIPPQDPFFAGRILRWPWGFAWMIAQISKSCQITPFYAAAGVNVVSLGLCLGLIYKISQFLIRDVRANLLSSLIAIFGITLFSKGMILKTAEWIHPALREIKAVPVFMKFTAYSGVPAGLVFFLLFVYAAIRLFKNKTPLFSFVLLLTGILGCGFVYTAFGPSLAASAFAFCAVPFLPGFRAHFPVRRRPILLILIALLVSGLLLKSYLSLVYSGIGPAAMIGHFKYMLRNVSITLFLLSPILLIIGLSAKQLFSGTDRTSMLLLVSVIAVNAGCYVCIHFPHDSEYKFLLLLGVTLGIFGGIAIDRLLQRIPAVLGILLLLAFLSPSLIEGYESSRRYSSHPLFSAVKKPYYIEQGIHLLTAEKEENELYQWIREHTAPDSLFIDSEWKIPVLGQRALFMGMDKPGENWITGYGVNMEFLKASQGYTEEEFNYRIHLIRTLYGLENSLPRREILHHLSGLDVYLVVRCTHDRPPFDAQGFRQIFASSNGNYLLYVIEKPSS